MSIELILTTFEDAAASGSDANTLAQLGKVLQDVMREFGEPADGVRRRTDEIQVELPSGTAEIRRDHAVFPIVQLDPFTLTVVFAVAKSSDLLILTEGGPYDAILISASQRSRLPQAQQSPEKSPVCRGAKHLGTLLEGWFQVHADFKSRAVNRPPDKSPPKSKSAAIPSVDSADWTAQHSVEAVKLSNHKGSKPTSFRWDPWVGDVVADGPEPVSIRLHRFASPANCDAGNEQTLRLLAEACRHYGQANKKEFTTLIDDPDEWPPLDLRMQFFSANFWDDRAEFTLYKLDDAIAGFLLEIARIANLSFVPLGGVVLVGCDQADQLPNDWKPSKQIVTIQSPSELKSWLIRLHIEWSPAANDERIYPANECELPTGTYPVARRRHVYLEALSKESAAQQQAKLFQFQSALHPDAGMLMSDFWRLETPEGKPFYSYEYSRDWLPLIREFAAADDRELGAIMNFERFVQESGQGFPLGDCQICKVKPDDQGKAR